MIYMSSSKLATTHAARKLAEEAMSPGPEAQPSHADLSGDATMLADGLERALAEGNLDALTPEALQAAMAALCRLYSAQIEAGRRLMPLPAQSRVMDTDVMVTASGLLRAVNLQVFELGMWQSWTGR
jgi:hypothetical protein